MLRRPLPEGAPQKTLGGGPGPEGLSLREGILAVGILGGGWRTGDTAPCWLWPRPLCALCTPGELYEGPSGRGDGITGGASTPEHAMRTTHGRHRSRAELLVRPGRALNPGVPPAITSSCEGVLLSLVILKSRHLSCVWQRQLPRDSRSFHLPGLGGERGGRSQGRDASGPQCGTWASVHTCPTTRGKCSPAPPELGTWGPHGPPGPVCRPPSGEATAGPFPSSALRAGPRPATTTGPLPRPVSRPVPPRSPHGTQVLREPPGPSAAPASVAQKTRQAPPEN